MLSVAGLVLIVFMAACSGPGSLVQTPSATTAPANTAPTATSGSFLSATGGTVVGQTSGRFTVTGNLITPRAGHTATLLPDGSVLVAGAGQLDIDDLLVSFPLAEILSPSGQIKSTGNLSVAREFHTATLLQDGKVLITGGLVFSGYPTWLPASPSAELYDPAVGKFTAIGNMSAPRAGHTASLLLDGRVLIFGGTSSGTPSAEMYDPAKGTLAPLPSPLFSRSGHTATVLPSGKVLFIGGLDNSGTLATSEIYDPSTNSFKAVGSMAAERRHHTATLLTNGRVLVAGGDVFSNPSKVGLDSSAQQIVDSPSHTVEVFDPQTETFSPAAAMNIGRSSHTATLLPDGTVLLCGGAAGWLNANGYLTENTAEIYDPATGSFKNVGTMNTGKFLHTATLLPNGTVVLLGGIDGDWALNVVETFK